VITDRVKLVTDRYNFPFEFYEFQKEAVGYASCYDFSAIWSDPGTGKTAISSAVALLSALAGQTDQVLVLVPPLLITQWRNWLTNLGVDTLAYKGSPKWRAAQKFEDWDAIVLSYQIFKRDHSRFMSEMKTKKEFIIIDEAAEIKNISTLVYKAVRDFCRLRNKRGVMLSGTPVTNVVNAYAYISIKTPEVYRSYRQFTTLHVTAVDPWGTPTRFANLESLAQALMLQSVRVRSEDVLELPEIQYVPIEYAMEPKHKRLYDKLVEEQLLVLDSGEVIDAVTAQRLYHTCQRLILAPVNGVFPEAFDIVRQMVNELDIPDSGEKLVIYVNYQDSNNQVFQYLQKLPGVVAVQAFGGITPKQSQENLARFLNDSGCNVLVGNPKTVGTGVDGLQQVCRASCVLELPLTAAVFQQLLARIHRPGQKKKCVLKMAIAVGTIQAHIAKSIIRKEDVVQKVMPTKQTLRMALTGK